MPAEQQVCRQHDEQLRPAAQQQRARGEQARAGQQLGQRMAARCLFVLLGRDDAGLALDARADRADLGEQCIRIFAGHAQLPGLIDQHAVVHAI